MQGHINMYAHGYATRQICKDKYATNIQDLVDSISVQLFNHIFKTANSDNDKKS